MRTDREENLVGLGFLFVSYIKSFPTHENIFPVGKSGPLNATFNPIFLGLSWPWVGDEFVGLFIDIGNSS